MIALARKLQSCGNEVAFIGVPDVEPFAHAASLDFVSFCEKDYPEGSISKGWGSVAKMHGIDCHAVYGLIFKQKYSCN